MSNRYDNYDRQQPMFQVDKSGAGVIESGSSLKKRREDMDDFTVYDMNAAADMRSASSRPQYDYRLGTDQNEDS